MYVLVDCNNFYASCERVFRPDLVGKPVVVLSNNDGCVIALSNEAKALGIPMGAPAFKSKELFKRHQVTVFSANFPLYGDMSNRVMTLLGEFSPEIEIYSIDEAFLKLTGFQYFDLQQHGEALRDVVTRGTGIPISVGIAPTKALSKVANRIAKKIPEKTKGVFVIASDEQRIKALKSLRVEDVWGIGRKHAMRLHSMRVINAYQFTQLSDSWVKQHMHIVGIRLKRDLLGKETLTLEEAQPKKSIACTRTFEKNYTQLSDIAERVSTFAVSCAEKLRKQQSVCNELMVFVHTNRHRNDLPQYSRNIVVQLPFSTNSSIELSKFATMALNKIFREGYQYKKAGVIVQNFEPERNQQLNVFANRNERHIELMRAVDHINNLFGSSKVRLGSQDQKRVWKMKQQQLSQCYTTKLSDIIEVKV